MYTIQHKTLDSIMEYGYILTYNPHIGKFAYVHRDDLKFYFGTGTDHDEFVKQNKVGYGETPEEAIEDLKHKSYDKK